MRKQLKKLNEGFTIVEVLIVLAIAALILTIILIAVPDLQRSSRNSNIYHDAQNVASAIQSYEGNNQGAVPAIPAGQPNNGPTITIGVASGSAATTTAAVQTTTLVDQNAGQGTVGWATNPTTGTNVGVGYLVVRTKSTCNGGNLGAAQGNSLTGQASPRAVAIYYPIETNGSGNVGCLQE